MNEPKKNHRLLLLADCTCNPDRLLDGRGHDSMCAWHQAMLGEVINGEGRPTGIRRQDALAMLDLLARIENSPELMKLADESHSPWVAINRFLDLFDAPHNVTELWVWNRFRWAFGRATPLNAETWKANDTLDELLTAVATLKRLSIAWHARSSLNWLKRRKLAKDIDHVQLRFFTMLGTVADNLQRWPDRVDFSKFAKGGG